MASTSSIELVGRESLTILSVFVVAFFVGVAIGILAWPALGRTLLAYGLAARIGIVAAAIARRRGTAAG